MKLFKVIGVSVLLFVLTYMIVMNFIQNKPTLGTAQARYEQAVKNKEKEELDVVKSDYEICVAEAELANEKNLEEAYGKKEATLEQVASWYEKRHRNCLLENTPAQEPVAVFPAGK
jgi:predicted metal-dependent hydrolase